MMVREHPYRTSNENGAIRSTIDALCRKKPVRHVERPGSLNGTTTTFVSQFPRRLEKCASQLPYWQFRLKPLVKVHRLSHFAGCCRAFNRTPKTGDSGSLRPHIQLWRLFEFMTIARSGTLAIGEIATTIVVAFIDRRPLSPGNPGAPQLLRLNARTRRTNQTAGRVLHNLHVVLSGWFSYAHPHGIPPVHAT